MTCSFNIFSLHLNWSKLAVSYLCSWSGLKLLYFRRNSSLYFFPMSNSTDLTYAGIKFPVWRYGSTWFVWMPILNLHYWCFINQRMVWSYLFFHLWLWFGIFFIVSFICMGIYFPLRLLWKISSERVNLESCTRLPLLGHFVS